MKLTKDNIAEIEVGTEVWIANNYSSTTKYQYMGMHDKGLGPYRIFSESNGNGISLLKAHEESKLSETPMFTTYEEACIQMRKQCINLMDHWNKHQLKDNPIPISEADQQFLWRNIKLEDR